jgi:hypothetical protein
MHRVDLHNGLKDLALDDIPGLSPAILHVASEVVDLDCETGTITLANGSTFKKDMIVVADGIHVWKSPPFFFRGSIADIEMIPSLDLFEMLLDTTSQQQQLVTRHFAFWYLRRN